MLLTQAHSGKDAVIRNSMICGNCRTCTSLAVVALVHLKSTLIFLFLSVPACKGCTKRWLRYRFLKNGQINTNTCRLFQFPTFVCLQPQIEILQRTSPFFLFVDRRTLKNRLPFFLNLRWQITRYGRPCRLLDRHGGHTIVMPNTNCLHCHRLHVYDDGSGGVVFFFYNYRAYLFLGPALFTGTYFYLHQSSVLLSRFFAKRSRIWENTSRIKESMQNPIKSAVWAVTWMVIWRHRKEHSAKRHSRADWKSSGKQVPNTILFSISNWTKNVHQTAYISSAITSQRIFLWTRRFPRSTAALVCGDILWIHVDQVHYT